jgi:predicted Zn-dependent protease
LTDSIAKPSHGAEGTHVSKETAEPTGSLATALGHAGRLLVGQPAKAAEQAREILKVVPLQPQAMLILGVAQRQMGDLNAALETLQTLSANQPKAATVFLELGRVLAARGESNAAITTLKNATKLNPASAEVWQALAEQYELAGSDELANAAMAQQIRHSTRDPALIEAASALCENKLSVAERSLRDFLKSHPVNVAAIRMLAETGARLGRLEDAENLLARCLELAPGFTAARHNYALLLQRQTKSREALQQVDILLREDQKNPNYRALKAAVLVRIGDYAQAIECYETLLKEHPRQPKSWMSYGHALKTVGRQEDSITAYRKSIALLPTLGEAWWSLANLKTFHFTPADIDVMQAQLAHTELSNEDRFHLDFALGKALEDDGRYGASFEHYQRANALRRRELRYNADDTTDLLQRSKALFSREFFGEHKTSGDLSPDAIFVVSLPRSGSTLVEQILSSHSAVEGTMELPDIRSIARRLGGKRGKEPVSDYPEILGRLSTSELRDLGAEYLKRASIYRRQGRPFFVDKMPNNFQHIGLIQLILPNAKIIDARRHPLGCCFSNFKQHFARGQSFAYDLTDLGRYYRDYVELMAHFDDVLPGKIHRVIYEDMVKDPEQEIRQLLAYCGLPFEEACLRFYETERAVRTASSEQVRLPIFTDAVDHWQNYEPWLGPLKTALGPVLSVYPGVPDFGASEA